MKSFFDPRVLKSSQGCHYPMVEPSIRKHYKRKWTWCTEIGSGAVIVQEERGPTFFNTFFTYENSST